jgi:hypothetical protein
MNRQVFLLLALVCTIIPLACGPATPKAGRVRSPNEVIPDPEEVAAASYGFTSNLAVAVQGKYAYVGFDRRLVVVDVADPRRPAALGHAEPPGPAGFWNQEPWSPTGVNTVAVAGKHAYVVYNTGGNKRHLVVFDIADPRAPAIVATYDSAWGWGAGYPLSVAVSGKHAYLYSWAGLEVIDISRPKAPKHVGSWKTHGVPTWVLRSGCHVAVAGNYAYVADRQAGLRVIDISNPVAPKEVGSFKGGSGRTVAVAKQHALILGNGGLHVIDVSDPKQPKVIGSAAVSGSEVYDLAATDRLACLYGPVRQRAGSPDPPYGGLRVVDLANPAAPKQVYPGPLVAAPYMPAVALQGTLAYVAERAQLHIADLADPAKPVVIGSAELLPPPVTDVAVLGDHAYLANGRGGLRVMNVADRTAPREVATFADPAPIKAVAAHDGFLLASAERCLVVLDVSDPARPREVATYDTDFFAPAVATAGKLGCITVGDGSLEVLDLSEPAAPQKIGVYRPLPERGWGADARLAASDDYVFVLHGDLRVVDLSFRRWLWTLPYLWPAAAAVSLCLGLLISRWRRRVKGVLWLPALAVALLPLALVPFVPRAPREVGHADVSGGRGQPPPYPGQPADKDYIPPDRLHALAVSGHHLYLAGVKATDNVPFVKVLDASDPARIRETGTCLLRRSADPWQQPYLGEPRHLTVVGNYAYVASGTGGVAVVDVADPAAPKVVGGCGYNRGAPRAVAILGQYAFMAAGRGGLEIADISNPAAPRLVGGCEPRPLAGAEVKKARQ